MKQPDDPRQISLLPPTTAEIVHLVRENLRLLIDLANRCEVGCLDVAGEVRAVRGPGDLAQYLSAEMSQLAQEQLRVANLDTKNHLLSTSLVYQGGLNATVIRLADCFREAVRLGAAAVILVHNHPSGDPTPSPEDVRLTAEAGRVGDLLGIDVLDHLVIGRPGFVSLRERGLYTPGRQSTAAQASLPCSRGDPAAA
ncbi:MAG: JAB domain-containing protein [Chloroflexota bacterium]